MGRISKNDIGLYDHELKKYYRRVIGGLGWPYADLPGFIVVVGEDLNPDHSLPGSPRHITVLAEHETGNLEELHRKGLEFRSEFKFGKLIGDRENGLSDFWGKFNNPRHFKLYISDPPKEHTPLSLDLVSQLIKKRGENQKTIHLGEASKIQPYLDQLVPQDVPSKQIDHIPAVAALGYVLVEIESHDPEAGNKMARIQEEHFNRRPDIQV